MVVSKITRFLWELDGFIYDLTQGPLDDQMYSEVAQEIKALPLRRIHEYGCGTGNLTKSICDGFSLVSYDYSKTMLRRARKKVKGARFEHLDFYKDRPAGEPPELIVACRSLYDPDVEYSVRAMAKRLHKGGKLLIVHSKRSFREFTMPAIGGKGSFSFVQWLHQWGRFLRKIGIFRYHMFSEQQWRSSLEKHFSNCRIRSIAGGSYYLIIATK